MAPCLLMELIKGISEKMKHLIIIIFVLLTGCATTKTTELLVESKALDVSIHDAASQGNINAIKAHIANGTDLNSIDESGWTPLHWATSKVHNKAAKLLITEGADVNIVNKDGLAPLDYAENELFGVLIDNGAKSGAQLKPDGK